MKKKGFVQIDNDIIRNYQIPIGPRAVFTFLMTCNPCFPSKKRICAALKISDNTLTNYTKWLEDHNMVKVTRHKSKDSKNKTNSYEILDQSFWKPLKIVNELLGETGKNSLAVSKTDERSVSDCEDDQPQKLRTLRSLILRPLEIPKVNNK